MKRNRRREPKQHRPLTDSEKEISGYLSGKWYCRMYENLPEVIDQSRDSVGLKMDVVKRIGRGGCGEVYMGKSHVDGKMIAIKRVLHSTAPLKAQVWVDEILLCCFFFDFHFPELSRDLDFEIPQTTQYRSILFFVSKERVSFLFIFPLSSLS